MLVSGLCRLGKEISEPTSAQQRSCVLTTNVLATPVSSEVFYPQVDSSNRDTLTEAFTTLATLKELNVISSAWVYVSASTQRRRAVRLFAVDPQALALQGMSEGQIHLSPCLLFNLGIKDKAEVEVVTLGSNQRVAKVGTDTPRVASRVTIARVRCPGSSGHVGYSKALRNFFRVPRSLAIGDIVCVPKQKQLVLESHADGEGEDTVIGGNEAGEEDDFVVDDFDIPRPTSLIYFCVTDLQFEESSESLEDVKTGMLVDGIGGQTMMTQAGAINARVPNPKAVVSFLDTETRLHNSNSEQRISENMSDAVKDAISLIKPEYVEEVTKLVHPQLGKTDHKINVGASLLMFGPKASGKRIIVSAIAEKYGVHLKEVSLTSIRGLPGDRAAKKLKQIFTDAIAVAPCILHLRNFHALAPVANGSEAPEDPDQVTTVLKQYINKLTGFDRFQKNASASVESTLEEEFPVFVVASTQAIDDTPSLLRSCFTHELQIKAPDKAERLAILEHLVAEMNTVLDVDVSLASLANKTAGRSALELKQLLANAGCLMLKRVHHHGTPSLTTDDIDTALENLPSTAVDIGAPKIPSVYWKDVGGLAHAKEEIMDMVQLPLEHPELFASGVRQRSGLLLYGPPGTGKTLIAKAVATECALNFISVKGPELLDMYIGESERKVRQVFETARSAKPCVLFFDELDSLAPQRGRGADSGGVMDRVVSQLLTEIDGMQGNSDVFVIGATNRPDLLDQSLLRPGRFDRLIYLGISQDRDAQMKIINAITRKYVHDADVDFKKLLDLCGDRFTGADFAGLCSGAMSNALKRRVEELRAEIDKQNMQITHEYKKVTPRKLLNELSEEELQVRVNMADYMKALQTSVPSVSEDELKHYEELRQKFSAT